MMEALNNFELVTGGILFIWSCVLVWGSWRVCVMLREVSRERAELRRWVRIRGLWERQDGRWR